VTRQRGRGDLYGFKDCEGESKREGFREVLKLKFDRLGLQIDAPD